MGGCGFEIGIPTNGSPLCWASKFEGFHSTIRWALSTSSGTVPATLSIGRRTTSSPPTAWRCESGFSVVSASPVTSCFGSSGSSAAALLRQSQYIRLTWEAEMIGKGSWASGAEGVWMLCAAASPSDLRPSVPSLAVEGLPRMSDDNWIRFQNDRVENTRSLIWISWRVAPEVFFAEVFEVSWPSFRPVARTTRVTEGGLRRLAAGVQRFCAEMARRGQRRAEQVRARREFGAVAGESRRAVPAASWPLLR